MNFLSLFFFFQFLFCSYDIFIIPNNAYELSTNNSVSIKNSMLSLSNPAYLRFENSKFDVSYINFPASISYSSFVMGKQFLNSNFAIKIQNLFYGKLIDGENNNSFYANDLGLSMAYNISIKRKLYIGSTLKFLHSQIESFHSDLIVFDLGCMTHLKTKKITLGLSLENFGFILKQYANSKNEIPKRFRFSIDYFLPYIGLAMNNNLIYNYNNNNWMGTASISHSFNKMTFILSNSLNRNNLLGDNTNSIIFSNFGFGCRLPIINNNLFEFGIHNMGVLGIAVGMSYRKYM